MQHHRGLRTSQLGKVRDHMLCELGDHLVEGGVQELTQGDREGFRGCHRDDGQVTPFVIVPVEIFLFHIRRDHEGDCDLQGVQDLRGQ